jgi:uncharacterized protein (TIGR00159 family)
MIALITVRFWDILDILLLALLLFEIYRLIRGTVAMDIFVGIFLVYIFWLAFRALHMEMMASLLGQIIGVGVIALIVVFQQEIRRFLLLLGGRYAKARWLNFSGWGGAGTGEKVISEASLRQILNAVRTLSSSQVGALIAIARESGLETVIGTGDRIDARINSRLLESIFFKNNPLHDGAVIIQHDNIIAARCVLPVTENIFLPAKYGMRHRAALGLAEKTDAVVIIVSEETGEISLAYDAEIYFNLSPQRLEEELEKLFSLI